MSLPTLPENISGNVLCIKVTELQQLIEKYPQITRVFQEDSVIPINDNDTLYYQMIKDTKLSIVFNTGLIHRSQGMLKDVLFDEKFQKTATFEDRKTLSYYIRKDFTKETHRYVSLALYKSDYLTIEIINDIYFKVISDTDVANVLYGFVFNEQLHFLNDSVESGICLLSDVVNCFLPESYNKFIEFMSGNSEYEIINGQNKARQSVEKVKNNNDFDLLAKNVTKIGGFNVNSNNKFHYESFKTLIDNNQINLSVGVTGGCADPVKLLRDFAGFKPLTFKDIFDGHNKGKVWFTDLKGYHRENLCIITTELDNPCLFVYQDGEELYVTLDVESNSWVIINKKNVEKVDNKTYKDLLIHYIYAIHI